MADELNGGYVKKLMKRKIKSIEILSRRVL